MLNSINEFLGGKRFLKKIESTSAHGPYYGLDLGKCGNKYDGKIDGALAKRVLEFKPTHSRHAHVADDTTLKTIQILLKKFCGALV